MSGVPKSMVSYASSFEDVILQRALKDVSYGCYVDVGAAHPFMDSNTAAFYEKGWRGICVEPLPFYPSFWSECRPEDILITAAAGASEGQTTLYYYANAVQVSTCSAETMELWRQRDFSPDHQLTVPVITLNQLMERFLDNRVIHLLSIDAEGYEKQVLQGFDLKKYHPWIIVLEAIIPGTHVFSYTEWEADVLAAGYTMVYQDGINRFYLSNTKPELAGYFSAPPTVWDGFVPYEQELATMKSNELEMGHDVLKAKIAALNKIKESDQVSGNFWDYMPHPNELARQRRISELEEENKKLMDEVKALQQSLELNNFLNQ